MSGPPGAVRPGTGPSPTLPQGLTWLPRVAHQLVVVSAPVYATTCATLRTYELSGPSFDPVYPGMPARIGYNGFSDTPHEGGGNTPTGVYPIGGTMYGVLAPPAGLRYPYHRLVPGDWWDCNPESPTYNSFVHTSASPGGGSEALWTVTPGYHHFAVIGYNMPAPVGGAGSAFFLHEDQSGATAGCVSLAHGDLVTVLTWLDPAKSPHIVMAPDGTLDRW